MRYVYLAAFIAGLLLAVRLMFFGAERRRQRPGLTPLRRSEPAAVGFLMMFGVAGYLLTRHDTLAPLVGAVAALLLGGAWAAVVGRAAVLMARVTPEHDPDDPQFRLQGHVGIVTTAIPTGGTGAITFHDLAGERSTPARSVDGQPIDAGLEVCIESIAEDDVAVVELWSLVEARL